MDIPKHLAIAAFCKIIDELPPDRRRTALGFTCAAIGKSPERTGLEFSVDRPMRHLYWDLEIEDLYDRLEYLVETVGLKEQLVVQGAVSYIETHFALWADVAFSQSCVAGFQRAREKAERQLTLPFELREDKQTDSQITGFITTLNEAIESAESRRIDAEETADYLKSEFDATYTLEFWDLLNHLKVEEMWPRLEKLFGESGENTDEDEEEGGESNGN
jgi:hypothetical protein